MLANEMFEMFKRDPVMRRLIFYSSLLDWQGEGPSIAVNLFRILGSILVLPESPIDMSVHIILKRVLFLLLVKLGAR